MKTKLIAEQFGMWVNQVNRYAKKSVPRPASKQSEVGAETPATNTPDDKA